MSESSETNNNIVVRFEIQIPQTPSTTVPISFAGAGNAVTQAASAAPRSAPVAPTPAISFASGPAPSTAAFGAGAGAVNRSTRISANRVQMLSAAASVGVDQPTNPAKVDPAGNLCVTASNDFCPDGHEPTKVFVKVMAPGDDIPGSPDAGATPANITAPGQWELQGVGGAVSLPPGTGVVLPWNQVVIWREYACEPGVWFIEVLNRQGESSEGTNCTEQAAALAMFETVSDGWTVQASGFSGEGLEVFNRPFVLQRDVKVAPGHLAWLIDEDGVFQPRIELLGHGFDEPFQLRLTYAGHRIAYATRRDQWNPVGVNQMRLYSAAGMKGPVEIPPVLEIVPS